MNPTEAATALYNDLSTFLQEPPAQPSRSVMFMWRDRYVAAILEGLGPNQRRPGELARIADALEAERYGGTSPTT